MELGSDYELDAVEHRGERPDGDDLDTGVTTGLRSSTPRPTEEE